MNSQFEPTTVQHRDGAAGGTSAGRLDWIARGLRRLEPAAAGAISIATGWLAATSYPGLPVLWLFSLAALAVGCWAWWRRAGQVEMTARALVLLGAAYVLHTSAGVPGGAAGVFFFWLAITPLFYAFVLKPAWGSLIAVAAVVEFTLASLWVGQDMLASLSAQGAFLLILPVLLAMKLGAMTRQPGERLESARTDSRTSLYNRSGLMAHGRALLESCRRERRELTLAVFDCNDLLEARAIYGSRTSRKLIDSIIRKMTLLAGDRGLAARTGPTQFVVALPMGRDKAVQAIERVLGNPTRFELEARNSEIVLVPNLMVETVSENGSLEKLFAAMCRGLSRLHDEEQRRQRYLQRERERRSRPMSVTQPLADAQPGRPVRAPSLEPDPVVAHQIPATIPMPLPTR